LFLSRGSRTALKRHQTLLALVDWSYALLAEQERLLFDRVSIFAGSWTLEAVEDVCSADGIASEDMPELLGLLVDRSMVILETAPDGRGRYHMLETLREYASERLEERPDGHVYRQRHAKYCRRGGDRGDRRGLQQIVASA
jgi:predicted ATPase